MNKRTLAELLLLLTTFIWGSTFVIVKGALEDASALSFVAVRFTLAGVLLLVLLARLRIDPKALLPATVLGVLLFCGYVFQTRGLVYTTPSKSAFITGFSVILVPLILRLRGVRLRSASIIGAVLGLLGIYLLVVPAGISRAYPLFFDRLPVMVRYTGLDMSRPLSSAAVRMPASRWTTFSVAPSVSRCPPDPSAVRRQMLNSS